MTGAGVVGLVHGHPAGAAGCHVQDTVDHGGCGVVTGCRHRRRNGPSVGGGVVDVMSTGVPGWAPATDQVQPTVERHGDGGGSAHRQRRTGGPAVRARVVGVDTGRGRPRRPVAAHSEEAPCQRHGAHVIQRHGQRSSTPPATGHGVVHQVGGGVRTSMDVAAQDVDLMTE